MSTPLPMPAPDPQPLWYKDAVICQLHVKLPYMLTLGPYSFFWFKLRRFQRG